MEDFLNISLEFHQVRWFLKCEFFLQRDLIKKFYVAIQNTFTNWPLRKNTFFYNLNKKDDSHQTLREATEETFAVWSFWTDFFQELSKLFIIWKKLKQSTIFDLHEHSKLIWVMWLKMQRILAAMQRILENRSSFAGFSHVVKIF